MTNEEKEVMHKLVEAHNLFVKLPIQHPDDIYEWVDCLHNMQRILMARDAVRLNPDLFIDRSKNDSQ